MSTTALVWLGLGILVLGTALYVAGRLAGRRQALQNATPAPNGATAWTSVLAGDAQPGAAERVDMVERLAMLDEPWCAETLRAAAAQERDPAVLEAIRRALSPRR